jgi:hypothetical protein
MPTKATTVTVVTNEVQSEGAAVLVRRTFRADNLSLIESDGSLGRLVLRSGRAPVAVFHTWSHAYLGDALLEEQRDELQARQREELQAAMDRESKLIEAISNLEKKIADTMAAVVANLK